MTEPTSLLPPFPSSLLSFGSSLCGLVSLHSSSHYTQAHVFNKPTVSSAWGFSLCSLDRARLEVSRTLSYVLEALQLPYKREILPGLPGPVRNKRPAPDPVSLEVAMDELFCFSGSVTCHQPAPSGAHTSVRVMRVLRQSNAVLCLLLTEQDGNAFTD